MRRRRRHDNAWRNTRAPPSLFLSVSLLGFFLIHSLPRSSTSFLFHLAGSPISKWAPAFAEAFVRRSLCLLPDVCELKPEWARQRGVTMDTSLVAIAIPATTENHFDHLFGAIDMRPRENQFPFLHPLPLSTD